MNPWDKVLGALFVTSLPMRDRGFVAWVCYDGHEPVMWADQGRHGVRTCWFCGRDTDNSVPIST